MMRLIVVRIGVIECHQLQVRLYLCVLSNMWRKAGVEVGIMKCQLFKVSLTFLLFLSNQHLQLLKMCNSHSLHNICDKII